MSDCCKGVTKNGERCRITANLVDGYCRLHRKQAGTGGRIDEDKLVLERSPHTGIPHYVACVDDPGKRWIVLAAVTVAALFAVALAVIFRVGGAKR